MRWAAFLLLLTGCTSTLGPYVGFEHLIASAPKLKFDDKFDWVQLRSGEWLKGRITLVRDGTVKFDSDELDELELDLDNVVEIRSAKRVTCSFGNPKNPRKPKVVTGRIVATKNKVVVGNRSFKRRDLISVIPGEVEEIDYWSGVVTFSLVARDGNSDQKDVGMYVRATRRAPSRIDFLYRGSYGEQDGAQTAGNHFLAAQWDMFLTPRWFVSPFRYDVYSDRLQNMKFRQTISAGGGWRAVDQPDMELDLMAGLGWQFSHKESLQPRSPEEYDQGVFTLGARYAWSIAPRADLTVDYTLQIGLDDVEDSTHHFGTVLSAAVWGDLVLSLGFFWDWVGYPQTDSFGRSPEENEYRLTMGLGWDF